MLFVGENIGTRTVKLIPINPRESPAVILELIYRLKIKDVMTRTVLTASREETLRNIQKQLKRHGITGVPIAEKKRLFGIISMDDILTAYENGEIDEPAERHMSTNLTVLEEDMPLSFAISYFDKYKYGRFPVLDRNRKLVGIITVRDINVALLVEIKNELQKLERSLPSESHPIEGKTNKQYFISKFGFEHAGAASGDIKKILLQYEIEKRTIRRAAVAAYELEMNLVLHSNSGKILFLLDEGKITIKALDSGPGIENVEKALETGYSTATDWIRSLGFGAGMGLPNVRRVSDDFEITSEPGGGTEVTSIINL